MPDTPSRTIRPLAVALAVAGIVVVLAIGAGWLNRRNVAREVLTGWLRDQGIASDVQVLAVGPKVFVARLKIGDPRRPDFTAQQVEVRYRPRLRGVEVTSVVLRRPVLRARLHGGQFSVGRLDPLVQAFLRRPPPNQPAPRITIEDGVLLLGTDIGAVQLTGDLLSEDGKLSRLAATSTATHLAGASFDARLGPGVLSATRTGERLALSLSVPFERVTAGRGGASAGLLRLAVQAPYPDLAAQRLRGPVQLRADLAADRITAPAGNVSKAVATASLDGQARGWISTLEVSGATQVRLHAAAARTASARAQDLSATFISNALLWTRAGGDHVVGPLRVRLTTAQIAAGDLRLQALRSDLSGQASATRAEHRVSLAGEVDGRGGWSGLGAPAAADIGQIAAIKRAARSFRFAAHDVRLDTTSGVRLGQPLQLRPDSGGVAALTWDGSAAGLTVGGGGLPDLRARLRDITYGGAPSANLNLTARASVGPVIDGRVAADGRLRLAVGVTTFTALHCIPVSAARLELGANDVEQVAARLCPVSGPLLSVSGGGWALRSRIEGAAAVVPFLQARAEAGAGRVVARGSGDRMDVEAVITSTRVADTASAKRFEPLMLSGPATLKEAIWRADLTLRRPAGPDIAAVRLTQDGRLGFGAAVIETPLLAFSAGGLQPAQITPLAAAIGPPVSGAARFSGRFDWNPQGASSRGVVAIPGLDFQSPAGPVRGLKGDLVFTSLAPLTAAPGQTLSVDEVRAAIVLTDLRAHFGLTESRVTVADGEASVGDGRILIESLELPLTPGVGSKGVLILEGVQLHDLVEASPFGDRVELNAKVSGRVPFAVVAGRVRLLGGELKAIEPGRLSIQRAALTGVQADGAVSAPGVAAPPPVPGADTFTDFAYQAMENLAFETLDASLKSREDGRLGVLFHIVGRHDPPTKQQIRLTLMDLLRKRFMDRKLPLPSGTGVNLTLDTTLNLDDLLADYAEYQRLRGSGPVQP